MKKIALWAVILLSLSTWKANGQAGILDNSFGNSGKVLTTMGPGDAEAWAMALQTDSAIVVGGFVFNGTDSDFALIRYTKDGLIDSTFGTNGIVTTPMGPGDDLIRALAIQPDGKIIAVGWAFTGSNYDMAMARYNTNGTLDNSFGNNGKVVSGITSGNDWGKALKISGWSIVVGGGIIDNSTEDFYLSAYKFDGSPDSSFGTNGIVITPMGGGDGEIGALDMQPDSAIVVLGTASTLSTHNFALARYHYNGILDSTFGTNGKVISTGGVNDDEAIALALQPDGKIIAGGYSNNGINDDFGLIRYTSSGAEDATFGTAGRVVTAVGDSNESIYSLVLQPDGKIIAAGSSVFDSAQRYALVRYDSNGAADNSFGTGGVVTSTISTGNNEAYAAALQPDGKIVVAGYGNNGVKEEFAVARYITDLNLGVLNFNTPGNRLLIYPNPVSQNATLQYTLSQQQTISITLDDMNGKTVKCILANSKQDAGNYQLPITFTNQIAHGPYLLVISSPQGKMSVEIIK